MTAIANKHGKPLIYVPILREQIFWAKNYQRNTGQKYVTRTKGVTSIFNQTIKILEGIYTNKKLIQFTQRLQSETSKKDPVKILVKQVKKKILKK